MENSIPMRDYTDMTLDHDYMTKKERRELKREYIQLRKDVESDHDCKNSPDSGCSFCGDRYYRLDAIRRRFHEDGLFI